MPHLLPVMFLLASTLALAGALLALWQSLRAAFGAVEAGALSGRAGSTYRATLLEEKAALLHSLKDLEFEKESGKISDADFSRLDGALRGRARQVLRLLDQDVGPYREKAEKLVHEHLSGYRSERTPYRGGAARDEPGPEPQAEQEQRTCGNCDAVNDLDATFCKRCGHRLASDEGEEATDAQEREASMGASEQAAGHPTDEPRTEAKGKGSSGSGEGGDEPTSGESDP